MPDHADQPNRLKTALADRYYIEHELGRGSRLRSQLYDLRDDGRRLPQTSMRMDRVRLRELILDPRRSPAASQTHILIAYHVR